MQPRSSASSSSASSSSTGNLSTEDAYNKKFHSVIKELNDLKRMDHSGQWKVKAEKVKRLYELKADLAIIISDASDNAPELLIYFLSKVAKQSLRVDINGIGEILTLFKNHPVIIVRTKNDTNYIETVHCLLLTLIADLNLLTHDQQEKRQQLLAFGIISAPASAVQEDSEEGVPGHIEGMSSEPGETKATIACLPGMPTSSLEEKNDNASPSNKNIYAPILPILINHFISEIKRKNAELMQSTLESIDAAHKAAKQQQLEAEKAHAAANDASRYDNKLRKFTLGLISGEKKLAQSKEIEKNAQAVFEKTNDIAEQLALLLGNKFEPKNWISCLNDFVSVYQVTALEARYIFLLLQDEGQKVSVNGSDEKHLIETLPSYQYFPEFIAHLNLFEPHQEVNRHNAIKSFLYANVKSFNDSKWMNNLITSLYNIQQSTSSFTEDKLFHVIQDLMVQLSEAAGKNNIVVSPQVIFRPLINLWKTFQGNGSLPLQNFVYALLKSKSDLGFEKITIKNGKSLSFFDLILKGWIDTKPVRFDKQRFPLKGLDDRQIFYFLPMQNVSFSKIQLFTYYIITSQLFPLLTNYQKFTNLCSSLFEKSDVRKGDIERLYAEFIAKKGIITADADALLPFQDALAHLLHVEKKNLASMHLFDVISLLSPDTITTLCQERYDEVRKYKTLVTTGELGRKSLDVAFYEIPKESSSAEVQYQVLFSADIFLTNIRHDNVQECLTYDKKYVMYDQLLQFMSNNADYNELQSILYFSELPQVWANLNPELKLSPNNLRTLLTTVLGDRSSKVIASKVNALCRAFAVADEEDSSPVHISQRRKLLEQLSGFENLLYYRLWKSEISPKFYESFSDEKNPFAKETIVKFIENPSFQYLYQQAMLQPSNENNFIQLIGLPKIRSTIIDSNVLLYLAKFQEHFQSGVPSETILFNVLRNLFIQFDLEDENFKQDTLIQVLAKIDSIIRRLDANEFDKKVNFIKKINPIIREGDNAKKIEKLDSIILSMINDYPLIEDAPKKTSDDVLIYLRKLQELRRTSGFTQDAVSLQMLENLLITFKNESYLSAILKLLTESSDPSSRIDFSLTRTSLKHSWLEFAWTNEDIVLGEKFLKLGLDECEVFSTIAGKSFTDCFIESVNKSPMILQDEIWRDVLVFLLTKNSRLTRQKITVWLASHAVSNLSSTEDKSEKSSASKFSISSLFKFIEPIHMINIALAFIRADRFDLLADLNGAYYIKTKKALWFEDLSGNIKKDFDSEIRSVLQLPPAIHYQSYMTLPGFFSTYNHIISTLSLASPQLVSCEIFINLALRVKQSELYRESMGREFLESVSRLQKRNLVEWSKSGAETSSMYEEIIRRSQPNTVNKFGLNDIIRLYNIIVGLQYHPQFPIKPALLETFEKPASNWYDEISKLHTQFATFKIAQKDPEEVKQAFLACNPSFNHVLNRGDAFLRRNSIEYFFKIFYNATRYMTQYPAVATWNDASTLTKKHQDEILQAYNNNLPVAYNEYADTRFFASICLISKYTLQKTPYHSQFIAIMGATYVMPAVAKKFLIDVSSGQGKTITIACTIACVVKTFPHYHKGLKPSFIPVETLTRHLATDNSAENKPFFNAIGITSGSDIKANTLVRYTTGEDLLFQYVANDVAPAFEDVVMRNRDGWILVMDEVDVALVDRKRKFVSASGYIAKDINLVLRIIWQQVISSKAPEIIKTNIFASKEYAALPEFLKIHLKNEIASFIQKAITVYKDNSIGSQDTINSGAVVTVEKNNGLVAQNAIGLHGEPQFRQLKKFGVDKEDLTLYELAHDTVYHSDVIETFPLVLGFSGSLGEGRQEYVSDGYETVNTANFNAKKRGDLGIILCGTEDEWSRTVFLNIKKYSDNGQPVLTFFEDREAIKVFYETYLSGDYPAKVNFFFGTESREEYKRIVLEATEAGTITLATRIGGRGVDFKLHNPLINSKGGLVVIVAELVDIYNAYMQMLARTAREDNDGTTLCILSKPKIEAQFKLHGIPYYDLNSDNVEAKIDMLRKLQLQKNVASIKKDKEKNYPWLLSRDFYQKVLPVEKKQETRTTMYKQFLLSHSLASQGKYIDGVTNYNLFFNRKINLPRTIIDVVLMLDITGSMRSCLETAKNKLSELSLAINKSNPTAIFKVAVITFDDYDRYKSYDKNLLLTTDNNICKVLDFSPVEAALVFLNNCKLGHGDDEPEALELALYHAQHRLHWTASQGGGVTRQVFVVTDSLPHGVENIGIIDNFPSKLSNPAGLDWRDEAAALHAKGIEIHVISSNTVSFAKMESCYKTLAGGNGSVTALNNVSSLVANMTNKVHEGQEIDNLVGMLSVSEQLSSEAMIDQLAASLRARRGGASSSASSTTAAEKKEAAAQLDAYRARHN